MSCKTGSKYEVDMELRRGPWTLEEDNILIHYMPAMARATGTNWQGLKRTGKSCRLRWLNYLKPDVKRGNLTPEEQILILDLHSRWGNRWSRIAQHLPGRTDNEIKNYWRTRVEKQAKQLKIDANSAVFRDAVRCFWMQRLLEKMGSSPPAVKEDLNPNNYADPIGHAPQEGLLPTPGLLPICLQSAFDNYKPCYDLSSAENCSPSISSDSVAAAQLTDVADFSLTPSDTIGNLLLQQYNALLNGPHNNNSCGLDAPSLVAAPPTSGVAAAGSSVSDCSMMASYCAENMLNNLWSMDELLQARKVQDWGNLELHFLPTFCNTAQ